MPKRDLRHHNAKEVKYYGFMMVVSFLVYFALARILESDDSLPQFLLGFTGILFVASSVFTISKYLRARKEPNNPGKYKIVLFAIVAVILLGVFIASFFKA